MHWLLFSHKTLFSSTCFEPQVLIFRRIQLYTCSIKYLIKNTILLYMFRASSAHLQEDTIIHMQHKIFSHKILFSSTCFEPQVFIFRRIQLHTSSIWYCHCLWEFLVACRYRQATRNSHKEWQYHIDIEVDIFVNCNWINTRYMYHWHRVLTQLQLTNISISIWYCHSHRDWLPYAACV